jgi:Family of unknown function (DUF6262)
MREDQENAPRDEIASDARPGRAEPRSEDQRMGGQQAGRENVAAVERYVAGLKERKESLPVRAGKPNWTAIATACGFARGVFYDNKDARDVIEEAFADKELNPEAGGRAAATEKKLETSKRRLEQRETRLAVVNAENEALRGEVKELKEKLRRYAAFEEVMAGSGRRYIP